MVMRSRIKSIFLVLVMMGALYFAFLYLYGSKTQPSNVVVFKQEEDQQASQDLQLAEALKDNYLHGQSLEAKIRHVTPPHPPAPGSDFKKSPPIADNQQQQQQQQQQQMAPAQQEPQQQLQEQQQQQIQPQQQMQEMLLQQAQQQQQLMQRLQQQQQQQQQLPEQQLQQQQNVAQQQMPPQQFPGDQQQLQQQQQLIQQQQLMQQQQQQQNPAGQQQPDQQQLQQQQQQNPLGQQQPVPPQPVQQQEQQQQQPQEQQPQQQQQQQPQPVPNAVPADTNNAQGSGLHPDVNIVPSTPPPGHKLPHKDCIPLPKSPKAGVQICIHPIDQDRWVSGSLKQNKLWEENLIMHMDKALQNDSDLMLIDMGMNIGEYTLWAAALGKTVVAVEMLMSNVELVQTALQLSGLSDKVTLVNNALYKDHRILETKFMSKNIGGSRLNTSKVYEPIDNSRGIVQVKTICIDDLLPLVRGKKVYIKMDIENSEHHALAGAYKFFQEIDVKIVQMEWLNRAQEESDQILKFMGDYGYIASKSAVEYTEVLEMRGDVFFLKKPTFKIS